MDTLTSDAPTIVSAGLDQVAPVQSVYVQGTAAWSALSGSLVRGEAGIKLPLGFGVFGYAQSDQTGPSGGVGARWTF